MRESSSLGPAAAENPARGRDSARQLWSLWRQGQRPDVDAFLTQAGALFPPQLAAVLRVDQRERWQTGERIIVETYLQRYPALVADSENALDLVYGEFLLREELGEGPTMREYVERFPPYADALALRSSCIKPWRRAPRSILLPRGGPRVPPRGRRWRTPRPCLRPQRQSRR